MHTTTVSFTADAWAALEKMRGKTPRSTFIADLIMAAARKSEQPGTVEQSPRGVSVAAVPQGSAQAAVLHRLVAQLREMGIARVELDTAPHDETHKLVITLT